MKNTRVIVLAVSLAVVGLGAGKRVFDDLGVVAGGNSIVSYPVTFDEISAAGEFQANVVVMPSVLIKVSGRMSKIYSSGRDDDVYRSVLFVSQTLRQSRAAFLRTTGISSAGGCAASIYAVIGDSVIRLADTDISYSVEPQRQIIIEQPQRQACNDYNMGRDSGKEFKKKLVRDIIGMALNKASK